MNLEGKAAGCAWTYGRYISLWGNNFVPPTIRIQISSWFPVGKRPVITSCTWDACLGRLLAGLGSYTTSDWSTKAFRNYQAWSTQPFQKTILEKEQNRKTCGSQTCVDVRLRAPGQEALENALESQTLARQQRQIGAEARRAHFHVFPFGFHPSYVLYSVVQVSPKWEKCLVLSHDVPWHFWSCKSGRPKSCWPPVPLWNMQTNGPKTKRSASLTAKPKLRQCPSWWKLAHTFASRTTAGKGSNGRGCVGISSQKGTCKDPLGGWRNFLAKQMGFGRLSMNPWMVHLYPFILQTQNQVAV